MGRFPCRQPRHRALLAILILPLLAATPAWPDDSVGAIAALQDSNPEARRRAADALRSEYSPAAATALIGALNDPVPTVRWAAAATLGDYGPPAAEVLIAALRTGTPEARAGAASALGSIGGAPALAALSQSLTDADAGVRREAINALSRFDESGSGLAIAKALNDDDAGVQWAAAEALGHLKNPESAAALIAALADSEVGFRQQLTAALESIGVDGIGPLAAALHSRRSEVQMTAHEVLSHLGRPAVERLLALGTEENPAVRRVNTAALAVIAKPYLEVVNDGLNNPDWRIRAEAAQVLRRIRGAGAEADLQARITQLAIDRLSDPLPQTDDAALGRLVDALNLLGTEDQAKAYVESGQEMLMAAGRRWLEDRAKYR